MLIKSTQYSHYIYISTVSVVFALLIFSLRKKGPIEGYPKVSNCFHSAGFPIRHSTWLYVTEFSPYSFVRDEFLSLFDMWNSGVKRLLMEKIELVHSSGVYDIFKIVPKKDVDLIKQFQSEVCVTYILIFTIANLCRTKLTSVYTSKIDIK